MKVSYSYLPRQFSDIDDLLKDINSIPSEIKHYDMYTNELLDNQVKIYTIKENIINLVCKCGSSTLEEILELQQGLE